MTEYNQQLIEQIFHNQPTDRDLSQQLHSITDYLRWTNSVLNRARIYYGHGYENAWGEAQQLVLGGLRLSPEYPAEMYSANLTDQEKQHILDLVAKRIEKRIPVAYLINEAWFCNLPFYVDERVLIPRSPISELIQTHFAGVLNEEPKRILDMCTGSGCIAIACATEFPEAEVDAVDLSIDALNVAEINIDCHQLNHRVFPLQSDLFKNLLPSEYDLIVTNPPYVDEEDLADMPVEFHYEPELALGSGRDGLFVTKQILAQAADYLSENGVLVCEVGNSMVHLIEQFPQVPFTWLELDNGGIGVFMLTKQQLQEYRQLFA